MAFEAHIVVTGDFSMVMDFSRTQSSKRSIDFGMQSERSTKVMRVPWPWLTSFRPLPSGSSGPLKRQTEKSITSHASMKSSIFAGSKVRNSTACRAASAFALAATNS